MTSTFFCDGAWSGVFSDGEFERSILAGSAGKITDEGLLLATACNTLESIFVIRLQDTVIASNSLPFVLAQADDDIDTRRLFDGSRLASAVEGLNRYVRSLTTLQGRRVQVFYHCNLLITPTLDVIEKPKPSPREFADFADYKAFLEETVTAITTNAGDARRQRRYSPIATISTGYDSPATAVLARKAGCTEALTFLQARREGTAGGDDSGEKIADILGIRVRAFERLAYLTETGYTEAENGGYPLVFAAWGKVLDGRLLFTGFHGDKVWDRNPVIVGPNIVRGDSSGSGITEFRLRVGFIHLPVPFIGCTNHAMIHRISNSPEMARWTLNNSYDRPIARRLVEEAGVPRELFGFAKRAVDVVLRDEGMKATLSPETFDDFGRFCEGKWGLATRWKSGAVRLVAQVDRLNQAFNRRLVVMLKRNLGLTVRMPRFVPRRLRALTHVYAGRESLLFHWAVRKLLPRYRLQRDEPTPDLAQSGR
jgi:hypothetical protein